MRTVLLQVDLDFVVDLLDVHLDRLPPGFERQRQLLVGLLGCLVVLLGGLLQRQLLGADGEQDTANVVSERGRDFVEEMLDFLVKVHLLVVLDAVVAVVAVVVLGC